MKFVWLPILFIFVAVFNGCGGSDSKGTSNVLSGQFIDAPVEGLKYETATQSGFTDENGTFKYLQGEYVAFKIGDVEIGNAKGGLFVTPLALTNETDLYDMGMKVTNIGRLLQTLDEDDLEEQIKIPSGLNSLSFKGIDLEVEADLNTFLTKAENITSKTYVLKDANSAQNHMRDNISKLVIDGNYSIEYTLTSGSKYSDDSVCSVKDKTFNLNIKDNKITFSITPFALNGDNNGSNAFFGEDGVPLTMEQAQYYSNFDWITSINSQTMLNYSGDLNSTKAKAHQVFYREDTVSGSNLDVFDLNISLDGVVNGIYNYGNGQCIGMINGEKSR